MDARLDHRQALPGLAVTPLIAADDRRLPARLDIVAGWRQPERSVDRRRVMPPQHPLGPCVDDPQGQHGRGTSTSNPRATHFARKPHHWTEGIDAEAVMRVKEQEPAEKRIGYLWRQRSLEDPLAEMSEYAARLCFRARSEPVRTVTRPGSGTRSLSSVSV